MVLSARDDGEAAAGARRALLENLVEATDCDWLAGEAREVVCSFQVAPDRAA